MSEKTIKKKTALEVTKNNFYSNYHSLNEADEDMFLEDCQFDQFTSLWRIQVNLKILLLFVAVKESLLQKIGLY